MKICNWTVRQINVVLLSALIFLTNSIVLASDGYGVAASPFTKAEESVSPQVFKLLKEAGIGWARLGFKWNEIEPEKEKYQFAKNDDRVKLARKHNIKVLGLLMRMPEWATRQRESIYPPDDLEDWKKYVKEVVTRYKNDVTHWEIWNEPDIKKFWKGTPEEYVNLLKEAYKVIKEIDPKMKVLSAGLDGQAEKGEVYLDKLLNLGMASYCDIIAFHPYGKTPEKSLERVKNFIAIMEKHKIKKPLWFTEVGWQAGGYKAGVGIVKDEETKALYLKQAFQLLRPYSEVIFWYRAVDSPGVFGLLELDKGNLKIMPAYDAYKEMALKPVGATN